MFVYQNKDQAICVTFEGNKPVETPAYTIIIKEAEGKLNINGTDIAVAAATEVK